MRTSPFISLFMFMLYSNVKSQLTIVRCVQNCFGNSECIQNCQDYVEIPGIGRVPIDSGVTPPPFPGGIQPGVLPPQPQPQPQPPAPVGCPDKIRVFGFSNDLLDGIYEKQQEKINDRPMYLNSVDVAIAYNQLHGDYWIIDKWNAGTNTAGYFIIS